MSEEAYFRDLMCRVRAGDQAAASELVQRYEPVIRRTIRMRLRDPRLGRLLDSMDICQSVLGSFFFRAALGQFELDQPDQLLKLLTRMARNKLANQVHHQRARRRDYRRMAERIEDNPVAAPDLSPSELLAGQELIMEAGRRLSAKERQLLDLRQQGLEWKEIARQLDGNADALRMRLGRAVNRVAQELGLEELLLGE
jgi:RNA polymerase sigma-70 factor (ECF subfamily)